MAYLVKNEMIPYCLNNEIILENGVSSLVTIDNITHMEIITYPNQERFENGATIAFVRKPFIDFAISCGEAGAMTTDMITEKYGDQISFELSTAIVENFTREYDNLIIIPEGISVSITAAPYASIFELMVNSGTSGSVVLGDPITNSAMGLYSVAEGSGTTAAGQCSHTEGKSTVALGLSISFQEITVISYENNVLTLNASNDFFDNNDIYAFRIENFNGKAYIDIVKVLSSIKDGENWKFTIEEPIDKLNIKVPNQTVIHALINDAVDAHKQHAEGNGSYAIGDISHVEGNETLAADEYAHAEGWGTISYGRASHAEGYATKTLENYSHSEGCHTVAGYGAHAEGSGTKALGYYAHSEGYNTDASGNYSHAEGANSKSIGQYAHAESNNTKAVGNNSHSEGLSTQSLGDHSHVEGNATISNGIGSHAEGLSTIVAPEASINCSSDEAIVAFLSNKNYSLAHGDASHVEGKNNLSAGLASHVEGGNNISGGDYSHAEGNNTISFGLYSHAEGYQSEAHGESSHAEGNDTITFGLYSHAEGRSSEAVGDSSHAECMASKAYGFSSHAEGYQTEANGNSSHSEGYQSKAKGDFCHAEGVNTEAAGNGCHVEGSSTKAYSYYSHAEGYKSMSVGNYSHAEGESTTSAGQGSHAEGLGTSANSAYQHVQGKWNVVDSNNIFAHIIGNGSSNMNRVNIHTVDWSGNAWYAGSVEASEIILRSSTEGSTKKFKVTVDDSGTLSVSEITEA